MAQPSSVIWYPEARIDPGPLEKAGYPFATTNLGRGAVLHSMVGPFEAARARLMGSDRVSWHFSVLKDGTVYQHYDIRKVCWHAGDLGANSTLIGIEHEGGAGPNFSEPLTDAQFEASARLVRWLGEVLRWPEYRVARDGQLREHRWIAQTACPSGRIPWDRLKARLSEMAEGVDQVLRDRVRAAAAFRQMAAVIEAGGNVATLPQDVKDTVKFILKVSGVL